MKYRNLHEWDLPPKDAIALQGRLREMVRPGKVHINNIRRVAGVDVSVKAERSKAAVVVLSFPSLDVVETVTHEEKVRFPYIPGLLSFREGPVILDCVKKLRTEPDAFMFDGQGMAHPRRLGIASHIGLFLDKPAIGCAKSHLYGDFTSPGTKKGDLSIIRDKDGTELGAVLRTRDDTNPVYVSPGHLIDIETSVTVVLRCSPRYKIPEPTRAAHKAAAL